MKRNEFIHQLLVSWLDSEDCGNRATRLVGVASELADKIHKVIPFDGEIAYNIKINAEPYPLSPMSYLECPWCGDTRYREVNYDAPDDTVFLRCSNNQCHRAALITTKTWDQIRMQGDI